LTVVGLENTVAVVTGGASGIGRAIVERLHVEGCRVACLDLDRTRGEELRDRLGVMFVPCDVTRETEIAAALNTVAAALGPVGMLVNNAGINAYGDAGEMTEAEWDRFFAVDLKAAWLCTKHALPQLRQCGGGAIINIASIHSFLTTRGMFPYAAAKSGVVGLTRSLALDHGHEGIRVNAVCPGWVRTRLVQEWFDQQPDPAAAELSVLAAHPIGRIGSPEEIAGLVAFLGSDDATFFTGAALLVDGGLSARFAV
jgi:NAD(P)-dependent dehydrogenase (short-subunit alcohol dehydrogenase family)